MKILTNSEMRAADARTIAGGVSGRELMRRAAEALYQMRGNDYGCFTDLLYDMEIRPAFDAQVVEILIRLDYFREFGMMGKL